MQQPFTKKYKNSILNRQFKPSSNVAKKSDTATVPSDEIPYSFPPLFLQTKQQFNTLIHDVALLNRLSAHLAAVVLVAIAIVLSQTHLPHVRLGTLQPLVVNDMSSSKTTIVTAGSTSFQEKEAPPLSLVNVLNRPNNGFFQREAVPLAAMPELPRQEIQQYTIESGDTVYDIAYKFGLEPETVLWSNPELEENPHWLQVGANVNILPFNGIYHQVGGSDTIESIANAYKISPEAIIDAPLNNLDILNPLIFPGQWLVVPGGSKPFTPPTVNSVVNYASVAPNGAPVGSGNMGWPITGRISQGYFGYHPALDIESPIGTAVLSIDSGFVAAAGWDNSGYGYHVVIDHGNGLQSMYAHLQSYYLEAGDAVQKGQAIGDVGMSGRSSGPHLHLEIRQGTIQLNPLSYLP